MENNWKIIHSTSWHMNRDYQRKEYRALHNTCTPVPYFYVQRSWKYDICINCGERTPNYIQFQVDLMNGK